MDSADPSTGWTSCYTEKSSGWVRAENAPPQQNREKALDWPVNERKRERERERESRREREREKGKRERNSKK